ncbi:MAG: T9SS type A sorting domain-containing protein, partial [Bacteroidetes bacterium]|nr:T9SS type A sorting domain-containing protein [Bacteroidota bacterium]
HVRVYTWSGTAWIQKGLDIDGEAAADRSGWDVWMPDANTLAIAAYNNDGGGNNAGHVRVYTWSGTAWVQKGVDIDGEAAEDWSGRSVSMPDANTLAIGATLNDGGGSGSGHVRVYTWSGTAWVQKGVDIDGEAAEDISGWSVSMPDANTLAIGAPYNDGGGNDAGHVRVYTWSGTAWIQKGVDIDGEAAGDWSGGSVSMPDANTLAIGAPTNDGGGIDAGHVRVYSLATVNVSENSLAAPLELYPNPASSILNVVVNSEYLNSAYSIFDNTGRVVLTGKLQSEVTSIQLGDLPSGVYTISVGDGIRQTFQVSRE